ncbi:elongation factor P [Candidatus Poribacteria bacterium]|jgi:elongation factor P|nr:elongation factor P [Candidatus Poribacteria bacterium]MBT5537121.1 elongation factor P [Candidatus Poribacteria bacterium]MBT5709818.1 elongation factor P [Candidatus Poribacteria bacterium]MBT7098929.1 elongation factor P [Candidatus Poribacteria bacterium]MBT7806567.1 elongation factor P [Candidatus Poribacteria bacterium]
MATTADFRNGLVIRWSGELYQIVYFQHVKPGKGGAFVRTKLRRISDGSVQENTFRAGHSVETVRVETRTMQYLYPDQDLHYFMDAQTYDQIPLTDGQLGDRKSYLKENMDVQVQFDEDGNALTIELPASVQLEVKETGPSDKGDTASGGGKPATLETGLIVRVPFFVTTGTVVKVDTRSGEYLGRA